MVEPTYRPAQVTDIETTYELFIDTADDLNRRNGRRAEPAGRGSPPARAMSFRRNVLRHDPDRYWVAEADGRMIGFAIGTLREDVWYLAALHVRPGYQAHGVGRELLRLATTGAGAGTVRTVLTDTVNPISNGLYMRTGMLHQDAMLTFDGALLAATSGQGGAFTTRPIELSADQVLFAPLDREVVGYARPVDHELWATIPNLVGRVLERAGEVVGYVYVAATGHVGPIAVADAGNLSAALDVARELAASAGAEVLHLRACGAARASATWALEHGLQLAGIGLLLSSAPVGDLARYVSSGGDALF